MMLSGIRDRTKYKIKEGKVIKVEAHPIPEDPLPIRVRGCVALLGDATGYMAKCSGEGIYFAAKLGRICGEATVRTLEGGDRMIMEEDLRREYLRKWDVEYVTTYKVLALLESLFYGSNAMREALVELCEDEYVQRMSLDSYMYKRLAEGNRWEVLKMVVRTLGSLWMSQIVGREMERLKL